jgi:hypothetical protein
MNSDTDYRPYPTEGEAAPPYSSSPSGADAVPSRYQKTTNPDKLAEKQARSQARAEARRTRRTLRLQQQQQEQSQEEHYKLTVEGDSSDESSVDENYDVASITESVHENLT